MADKDNIDKALPNVDPEVVEPREEIVVTNTEKIEIEIIEPVLNLLGISSKK